DWAPAASKAKACVVSYHPHKESDGGFAALYRGAAWAFGKGRSRWELTRIGLERYDEIPIRNAHLEEHSLQIKVEAGNHQRCRYRLRCNLLAGPLSTLVFAPSHLYFPPLQGVWQRHGGAGKLDLWLFRLLREDRPKQVQPAIPNHGKQMVALDVHVYALPRRPVSLIDSLSIEVNRLYAVRPRENMKYVDVAAVRLACFDLVVHRAYLQTRDLVQFFEIAQHRGLGGIRSKLALHQIAFQLDKER